MSFGTLLDEGGALARSTRILAAVAGICLIGMVVVIAYSVVSRYLFNAPLLGANELVQMSGVCVVMLALPYATLRQAHVRVDIFDAFIGHWGQILGDILTRLISGYILADLVRRGWKKMLDAFEYTDTTNMLGLPLWPFYAVLTIGAALCILVFLFEIIYILTQRKPL